MEKCSKTLYTKADVGYGFAINVFCIPLPLSPFPHKQNKSNFL